MSHTGAKQLDYSRRADLDDSIPIVLSDMECSGNEVRLTDCNSSTSHNCLHWDDVAVHCNRDGLLINAYCMKELNAWTYKLYRVYRLFLNEIFWLA